MPNIKSAIKRVSVIEKKTARNNMIKTGYRTAVKKFEKAVEEANVTQIRCWLAAYFPTLTGGM